jgi:hypothetical protein
MFRDLTQLHCWTNWNLEEFVSKFVRRGMESIAVSVVTPSAQYRAKISFWTKRRKSAPARGKKMRVLRM